MQAYTVHSNQTVEAERGFMDVPCREREVLERFYVQNEPASRICAAMGLNADEFRKLKSQAKRRVGALLNPIGN